MSNAVPFPVQNSKNEERANAEALAREILHLKSLLESKKQQLKDFVQEHGPVDAGDCQFVMQPGYSWRGEPASLFNALRKRGIHPLRFFKVGSNEINAIFKETNITEDDLKALGYERVQTQSTLRPVKKKGTKKK